MARLVSATRVVTLLLARRLARDAVSSAVSAVSLLENYLIGDDMTKLEELKSAREATHNAFHVYVNQLALRVMDEFNERSWHEVPDPDLVIACAIVKHNEEIQLRDDYAELMSELGETSA